MKNAFEEYIEWFDNLSFSEKLEQTRKIIQTNLLSVGDCHLCALRLDGYLQKFANEGVRENSGDYYVYLWKHAWGEPFYVGSGTGDRWTSKCPRCDGFYSHLDAGDAIVYKILDGVDGRTARMYEQYVSANLTTAGYPLVNGDNNVLGKSKGARDRLMEKCSQVKNCDLTSRVEKAVFDILNHNAKCDYRITSEFIKEYGANYFSRKYSSIAV